MHPPVVDPLSQHDTRAGYEFEQPKRFLKTCTVRDGVTGLRCKLPEHGPQQKHRSERGEFRIVAELGQKRFIGAELRDELATAQMGSFDPVMALQEGL